MHRVKYANMSENGHRLYKCHAVDNTAMNVNNVPMSNIEGYVRMGQHHRLRENNQDKAVQFTRLEGLAA